MKLISIEERVADGDIVHFETGKPVQFEFIRSTEAAPYLGSMFQQDIEPHGRYMLLATDPSRRDVEGWSSGTVSFQHPLVIAFNSDPSAERLYGETSWKAQLFEKYGKTGRELSRVLAREGVDGIITVKLRQDGTPLYTSEIVDLTSFHPNHPSRLRERLIRHEPSDT